MIDAKEQQGLHHLWTGSNTLIVDGVLTSVLTDNIVHDNWVGDAVSSFVFFSIVVHHLELLPSTK